MNLSTSNHIETSTVVLGYATVCAYCFHPAEKATEWDDRDENTWWFCRCEMAEKEAKFKKDMASAKNAFEITIQSITRVFENAKKLHFHSKKYYLAKYEAESSALKVKYETSLATLREEKAEKRRAGKNWEGM
jgi:hypothetical protein